MLFLLALPIFMIVAAVHRYLALYAPSNVLIRHVRTAPPRWRTVGALVVLTGVLLLTVRAVEIGIKAGAPGWLDLIALVLAWDAIKFALLAAHAVGRATFAVFTRVRRRSTGTRSAVSSFA